MSRDSDIAAVTAQINDLLDQLQDNVDALTLILAGPQEVADG